MLRFFQNSYPNSEALFKKHPFFKNETYMDFVHNIYHIKNYVNKFAGGFSEWVAFKWENKQKFRKCNT